MKNTRIASVPLITNDPYFSVWSPADKLYDTETVNWTGKKQPVTGTVTVNGKEFLFMGKKDGLPVIEQTGLEITALSSIYTFRNEDITLQVKFTSPLLLTNLDLVSRPCTYIDFAIESSDDNVKEARIKVSFDEAHCHHGMPVERMLGGVHEHANCKTAWMGKREQSLLVHSGDDITIDWGYLYLTVPAHENDAVFEQNEPSSLTAELLLNTEKNKESFMIASYDDVAAINYFGAIRPAYWAKDGKTIMTAIEEAVEEHDMLISKCQLFGEALAAEAISVADEKYALICSAAYRQTIAAHKLITDTDGEVIFLSKECFSNGCIGTVDVSYPSVPLYLMYNPELVKGMMRPIFKYSRMPVWEYDFAPHDVGRYPHATGQVYGARVNSTEDKKSHFDNGDVYPPFYTYPKIKGELLHKYQMPVEECGNMLVMAAAVAFAEADAEFLEAEMDLFDKWVTYLIKHGENPGDQLCTDDFAGHLAQNINLSAKAIMGVESYAMILDILGRSEESADYHHKAAVMAKSWEERAVLDGHTALTFEKIGWSLKYNLIWDMLFESELFDPAVFENEIEWYLQNINKFGVPLDTRNDYTKSDWILWVASFAQKREDVVKLIEPVHTFLCETEDRVPFGDWFDTKTGKQVGFQNRTVQGGLFMPIMKKRWQEAEDLFE